MLKVVMLMSKYTTTLRFICESSESSKNDVIQTFSSYDINDYLTPAQAELVISSGNWTKLKLADKIIKNYYFREIGFETWALFKHHAKIEMELLMEHYLPMIYSRCIEYDPLINVDFTESYTSTEQGNNTATGSSTSNTSSKSDNTTKFSDTPNVGLDNISSGKYLTTATLNDTGSTGTGETQSTNAASSDNTQQYTKTIKGNSGVSATAQRMVQQFRDNIIAIDAEIIQKLNPLFMGIY